uniref:Calpain-2 catalytic subunit n=1 Tax=Amphiprion percula TaxID=161767 RepID=A0A3P8TM91_AMPPE
MSGIAATLQHRREKDQGVGSNCQAVRYLNQDYEALRQRCFQSGCLFQDDTFPAEASSLGFNELGPGAYKIRGVDWIRPMELTCSPEFIVSGATRTDVCQGALGDCWLLAAIASLTLNREVLARVVPHGQSFRDGEYAGIFHFQVEPTEPELSNQSAVFSKPDRTNRTTRTLHPGADYLNRFQITSSADSEAVTHQKFFSGTCNSSSDWLQVEYRGDTLQLIWVRNPWGQVEWTGAWSDDSIEWRYVSDEDRERLSHCSEDGEFWMSFSDFLRHYSRLEICNLTPDALTDDSVSKWALSKFDSSWRRGSIAGGCRNYPNTFWTNPQLVIRLEEEDDDPDDGEAGCTFVVGLIQKNRRRMRKMGQDMHTVGFAIYEFSGQRNVHLNRNFFLRHSSAARSETFINLREVCSRLTLPPGEYLLVPSTFEPHKDGDFCVRVFTEKQADFHSRIRFSDLILNLQIEIDEDDVDDRFRGLFGQLAGGVSQSQRSDIQTSGFSISTCRHMVNLLDRDGSGKLGLVEFKVLWIKIENYLKIYRNKDVDNSGTMSSTEMRIAVEEAGFSLNNALHQVIVARYSESDLTIDFDNFVSSLVRLETMFNMFKTLDKNNSGTVELNILQVGSFIWIT